LSLESLKGLSQSLSSESLKGLSPELIQKLQKELLQKNKQNNN